MKVTLVAATQFFPPADIPWEAEGTGGQDLAELSGRLCYLSWNKPNPKTATNVGYIDNIMAQMHYTVIEHASVSFLIEGISRSLSHELIRHRIGSYSQTSQRFIDSSDTEFVVHPTLDEFWDLPLYEEGSPFQTTIGETFEWIARVSAKAYADVAAALMGAGKKRKEAREAAREFLPNATETKIVTTFNLREWRHFLTVRGSEHADRQIRALAVEIAGILTQMPGVAHVFQDVEIYKDDKGIPAVRVGKSENG